MGKKLLYFILTVAVSGLMGYLAATWTLDRRLPDEAGSDEVLASAGADKKAVP